MTGGVIAIGNIELFASAFFMVAAAIVSWCLKLEITKSIVIATVRAFIQLLGMGFLLVYLFEYQSWWLVALVFVAMSLAATQIVVSRLRHIVKGLWLDAFISVTVSSLICMLIVAEGIIHPDPWYAAKVVLPVAGVALGNTLAAAAVAVERLYSSLDARAAEIYMMVALGATPKEAAFPSIRQAVKAGITPTLATLSAAGIVQIPGMMSGQILAGADPVMAAKYQVVMLIMVSAATTFTIAMLCFMAYKKRFSADGFYLNVALRENSQK